MNISRVLAPLIPDNYKSIPASSVARALLAQVPKARGKLVMLSSQLRRPQ